MTALAHLAPHATTEGRPGPVSLVRDQVIYSVRELWRSRLVLVFTFVLPLAWLGVIGVVAGNEAVDPVSGVRVMQFATPMAAVMGAVFAAYPPVAMSLALAREQRITKRLRGTPLPSWAFIVGRAIGAAVLATFAVLVMLLIGVLAFAVQIQWQTLPATVVTLAVGIACLAALGLAVGALAPSGSAAQTAAIASAVAVLFVSGMMTIGSEAPAWMNTVGSIFPVRPLLTALQDQFDPFLSGSGWSLDSLIVMTIWGLGGIVLASWAMGREPSTRAGASKRRATAAGRGELAASQAAEPGRMALAMDQMRWTIRASLRTPSLLFFAVAMPVGLYALMASTYPDAEIRPGEPLVRFMAAGMAAYGAGVTAFVNMPATIAQARDQGLLKRLRGTPLAPWQYLFGRTAAVLGIGLVIAALVYATASGLFGVQIPIAGVPLAVAVLLLGTITLAACGFALVAVAPGARAVGVMGLSILLPLSFFSDVFPVGGAPDWMATVGSLFPLRHFVHALAGSLDPAGLSVAWTDIAAMGVWLIAATLVAIRYFRWEPTV
jgi:ABC-type multidrug transport system permease subunit